MKKLLSLVIAVMSIFTLCFTACNSPPHDNYSLEQKIEKLEEQISSRGEQLQLLNNLYISNEAPRYNYNNTDNLIKLYELQQSDGFKDFCDYYKINIKAQSDKNIFLFDPKVSFAIPPLSSFLIYAENSDNEKLNNPFIIEQWTYYVEELGKYIPINGEEILDGEYPWNLKFLICLAPYESLSDDSLKLMFGQSENSEYENFANIFMGKTCIATLYYTLNYKQCEELKVSYAWIANYIKNNLINGVLI